jgi:sulfur relay (sulfurtransferase) DsrF/TusC family protein
MKNSNNPKEIQEYLEQISRLNYDEIFPYDKLFEDALLVLLLSHGHTLKELKYDLEDVIFNMNILDLTKLDDKLKWMDLAIQANEIREKIEEKTRIKE